MKYKTMFFTLSAGLGRLVFVIPIIARLLRGGTLITTVSWRRWRRHGLQVLPLSHRRGRGRGRGRGRVPLLIGASTIY